MKISILSSDKKHPVNSYLQRWLNQMLRLGHKVDLLHDKEELSEGDILFLVSCSQIISQQKRNLYKKVLVLHASALPEGRGWSPHIWEILNGGNEITISLLEAEDPVDTGNIWFQKKFKLEGHELLSEINEKLFKLELELMSDAVGAFGKIKVIPQGKSNGEYLRRLTPDDSRLDPQRTIAQQFQILRVSDPERHPAFFDYLGKRYILKIEKEKCNEN
jgi:methionyl-tRNA formyltransferase